MNTQNQEKATSVVSVCEREPVRRKPRWIDLADRVLGEQPLNRSEALQILKAPDADVLELMTGAYRIRKTFFEDTVQLYYLMNAKSGICPEDCSYCSQSKVATSEIPKYNLLSRDKIMEGARQAKERQSKTYCIVISARGPNEREIAAVEELVPEIKKEFGLDICACLGLLTEDQAERLKACGVDRVNHNLNTGREFYSEICTTHTYDDRMATLSAVRKAGMELCSGGIVGMGERDEDVVDMAFTLREMEVESIPINFLNPIDGTPLAGSDRLTPRYCLKVLALFRFTNPRSEIRIAGGREIHLGALQPLGLYAANSMFVGDYLTTSGQPAESDYKMIEELGFRVTNAPQPDASPCTE